MRKCTVCGADHIAKGLCRKHYKMPSQSKPKAINKISKSMKVKLKSYAVVKAEYLKLHPVCEFDGCQNKDVSLHHMKGRVGLLLTDIRHFKSLCLPHHRFVEENPTEAQKLGLSSKRLNND